MDQKFRRASGASLFVKFWIVLGSLLCAAPLYAASVSLQLTTGWNLLGNSQSEAIPVTAFGDAKTVASVWRWNSARAIWQFYTPALDANALKAYADGKGYEVLNSIGPGQGFWVNAKASAAIAAPSGAAFDLSAADLAAGWNLLAIGVVSPPGLFGERLAAEQVVDPLLGAATVRVTTLWAWDTAKARWYFFSPTLDAAALAGYANDKGYLDFQQNGKALTAGMGFWLNATRVAVAPTASGGQSTLTVATKGARSGKVVSSPAGIDCGATCSKEFPTNTVVTLTAAPSLGTLFSGWSGACQGMGTCTVTLSAAKSVTAAFTTGTVLTVTKDGVGSVTSAPAGIDCGTVCANGFASDSQVTLTAHSTDASIFQGWSGACQGAGSCVVTLDVGRSVKAIFRVAYTLSVTKAGAGSGRVTGIVAGTIDCGVQCAAAFAPNTEITLRATPDAGSVFAGWSGACASSTAATCWLPMNEAKNVTATFAKAPPLPRLQVYMQGDGSGSVSSTNGVALTCGDLGCTATTQSGATVKLNAVASGDSTFEGWSGACQGSAAACTIVMDGNKDAVATFKKRTETAWLRVKTTGGYYVGKVTSTPEGIQCPDAAVDSVNSCEKQFTVGSLVKLVATPQYFLGWSGDCSGKDDCYVAMGAEKNVTANYGTSAPTPAPSPTPIPNPTPTPAPGSDTPDADGCFKVDPPRLTVAASRLTGNLFCPDCLKIVLSSTTKRIFAKACIVGGASSDCGAFNVPEGGSNSWYGGSKASTGYTLKYVGSRILRNDWVCMGKAELVQMR